MSNPFVPPHPIRQVIARQGPVPTIPVPPPTGGGGCVIPTAGSPLNATFLQPMTYSSFSYGSFPGVNWGGDMTSSAMSDADFSGGYFGYIGPQPPTSPGAMDYTVASCSNFTKCKFGGGTSYAGGAEHTWSATLADFTYSDFSGSTFVYAYCLGSDFTGSIFRDCLFINTNFNVACLIGADFTGATFQGIPVFDGCLYDDTTKWPVGFDPTTITGATHVYADYSGQKLVETDLSNVFLGHANFKGATLQDVVMNAYCGWADFTDAKLLGCTIGNGPSPQVNSYGYHYYNQLNLGHAILVGATIDFGVNALSSSHPTVGHGIVAYNWAHADFTGVKFVWSGEASFTYKDANFNSVNMAYSIFDNATLGFNGMLVIEECNAAYASFKNVAFGNIQDFVSLIYDTVPNSNLSYCNFEGASGGLYGEGTLSYANFDKADMTGADFEEANLSYANFATCNVTSQALDGTNHTTLSGRVLPAASYNSYTTFPSTLNLSTLIVIIANSTSTGYPQDLSYQTLNPPTTGGLQLYEGEVSYAQFVGTFGVTSSSGQVQGYNANFQGCQFNGATLTAESITSSTYQSHFGSAPPGYPPNPPLAVASAIPVAPGDVGAVSQVQFSYPQVVETAGGGQLSYQLIESGLADSLTVGSFPVKATDYIQLWAFQTVYSNQDQAPDFASTSLQGSPVITVDGQAVGYGGSVTSYGGGADIQRGGGAFTTLIENLNDVGPSAGVAGSALVVMNQPIITYTPSLYNTTTGVRTSGVPFSIPMVLDPSSFLLVQSVSGADQLDPKAVFSGGISTIHAGQGSTQGMSGDVDATTGGPARSVVSILAPRPGSVVMIMVTVQYRVLGKGDYSGTLPVPVMTTTPSSLVQLMAHAPVSTVTDPVPGGYVTNGMRCPASYIYQCSPTTTIDETLVFTMTLPASVTDSAGNSLSVVYSMSWVGYQPPASAAGTGGGSAVVVVPRGSSQVLSNHPNTALVTHKSTAPPSVKPSVAS